ncbi:TIGR03751 family conjugal transfer lipoprotein [Aquisalimonas asiatica]|uniref:Conjugative transfer region lipoprotein, TIGR03751 family n=1 Tax=Aquisalimonas asiatica TaxID=406100 RepID=A0A1H8VRE6_9GAMM|nr:TIGR03751 family conjugal transfer lipoprotein [Aquisalimonas asiatica]SEP17797.1 conjugative transfer region lipoprotein, TIGR03751 family [Aquisalimonas asiatica]
MRTSCARATALVAVSISAFIAGCETTPGHKVFPDDGPTMDEVYEGHFRDMRGHDADGAREALHSGGEALAEDYEDSAEESDSEYEESRIRQVHDGDVDLDGYTRTAADEIATRFSRVPNPTMVMYVYPHLAGQDEAPVPGYATSFRMYERDHYALPGEAGAR